MAGRGWRLVWLAPLWVLLASLPRGAGAASAPVETAHLDGEINSVSANYLEGAVARAEADHAGALVIVTDTPGGISIAMDSIVSSFLRARVPIAVWVGPPGARAASAGLFVAQAADVVAMAPNTNIGSAHPVAGNGADIGGDLRQKVVNDAVARIRSLADRHGRNAAWCEQAVRQSVNIDAAEAVRLQVADLVAPSLPALLTALDGRPVTRPGAPRLVFHTAGASPLDLPMNPLEQVLQALIDPNVAYVLLLLAILGLITEITSPGAVLPGVFGGICGLLALVAFTTLPISIGGALLVALAFLLFVLDVKAPTHGALTVGGLVSLALGSALLIQPGPFGQGVDLRVVAVATLLLAGGFLFVVRKAVLFRTSSASRAEALLGATGEVREGLSPGGRVWVAGELWPAVSAGGSIARGERVRVVGQGPEGLRVEPAPSVSGDPR